MEMARLSDGSTMDRLLATGSPSTPWQSRMPVGRDAGPTQNSPWASPTESNPIATLDSAQSKDPAAEQQRMLHFISHVNAECFISLLQTMDPMPDDGRARTEYQRRYRQLREVLEVPLPPLDPRPAVPSTDPVR
jgi:hypothetical protein